MAAAVCFQPDGSEASLVFGMQPGSYNSESIMEFLTELHRHLGRDKVTLIWDGPAKPAKCLPRARIAGRGPAGDT